MRHHRRDQFSQKRQRNQRNKTQYKNIVHEVFIWIFSIVKRLDKVAEGENGEIALLIVRASVIFMHFFAQFAQTVVVA